MSNLFPFKLKFDLKLKFFFFNVISLFIAVVLLTVFDLNRQNQIAMEHVERKILFMVKLMEPIIPRLMAEGNTDMLNELTKKITTPNIEQNSMISVSILDSRSRELVSSSRGIIKPGKLELGGSSHIVVHPIRARGSNEISAILRFTYCLENMPAVRRHIIRFNLGLFVFMSFISLIGAYIFSRILNKPITSLLHAAKRVSEGETPVRIDEQSGDEIGTLITSFNKMTQAITVHLEDLRLRNQTLDKRVFELSTLHHAGKAINSVLNLDQLYECIVDTTNSVLGGVKRCSLMLVDRRSGEFNIKITKGIDVGLLPKTRRVPISDGLAGKVYASGESAIINDLEDENNTRFLECTQVVRSSLIVPLKRNDEVIGIISASNKITGEAFTPKDRNMLESLAIQAGIAIKNAKLYQDLNRKILELNTLHEVGKSLSMVLELEKLLEMILEMTGRVLGGVRKSSLILYDKESNLLNVKVYKGMQKEKEMHPIRIGEGIAGKVFECGEPIMINNLSNNDQEMKNYPTLVKEGLIPQSSLCVPLKIKDSCIGVLSVSDKLSGECFDDNDLHMLVTLASQIAITLNNASLYEDLEASYLSAVRALANSLDAKDAYTRGHSERVAYYSLEIGKTMKLPPDDLKTLHIGALLHDIGKIGISETIINKDSRLTEEEYELVKTHPVRGASIIEPAKFLKSKVPLIKFHHERYDGKGYPEGLKGENIPFLARIVCVADSYDAMTSKRAYRAPMSREAAIKELLQCSGNQFDARVVAAFLEVLSNAAKLKEIEKLSEQ